MRFKFKPLFYFFVIPVLSLLIISLPSQAQVRSGGMNADGNLLGGSTSGGGTAYIPTEGWSVALNGGYESPMANLKETYKAVPTAGIMLSKKMNHLILSGGIDYREYVPKEAVSPIELEYLGQTTTIGTITISNFRGVGAYVGAAYETLITPASSFYLGINGGYIFTLNTLIVDDGTDIQSSSVKTNIPLLTPKIGLNFAVTNRIGIGLEGRYTLGLAKGYYNVTMLDIPTQSFKSVAANLILHYNF